MIYFTSDFHFNHDRDFIYKRRNCISIQEMNDKIIENFNNTLKWDDELYILGDCMLGNNMAGLTYLKQIPGYKYIILGNHDTIDRVKLYKQLYRTEILGYSTMFNYCKFHMLLSHYPTITGNYDDGKKLEQKVINLCGHSHTTNKFNDMDKGLIYHVELDAHNCYPVSIEQIIKDIKEKINER